MIIRSLVPALGGAITALPGAFLCPNDETLGFPDPDRGFIFDSDWKLVVHSDIENPFLRARLKINGAAIDYIC